MSTKVKIDFYKVTMPEGAEMTFEEVLRSVSEAPNDQSRNVELRGTPIRLRRADQESDLWVADMTRIRMDGLPVKAKLSGRIQRFDFGDDEGVGEESAFLYVPAADVLVLQRHRSGVSASALAWYFQRVADLPGPIALDPILLQRTMERLDRLTRIRHFDFRIAPLGNPELLRSQGLGLGGMIDLLARVNAPQIAVSMSVGRQRTSLAVAEVVRMAKSLFRITGSERDVADKVKRIVISGDTADDESDIIDLLNDRMQEVEDVESDGSRRLTYRDRRTALHNAWERRQEELRGRFAE